MIIDNQNPSEAEEFVGDLQRIVGRRSFSVTSDEPVSMTISVGVAHSRAEETLKKTLSRADIALYQAKEGGRNKVVVYFPLS